MMGACNAALMVHAPVILQGQRMCTISGVVWRRQDSAEA